MRGEIAVAGRKGLTWIIRQHHVQGNIVTCANGTGLEHHHYESYWLRKETAWNLKEKISMLLFY